MAQALVLIAVVLVVAVLIGPMIGARPVGVLVMVLALAYLLSVPFVVSDYLEDWHPRQKTSTLVRPDVYSTPNASSRMVGKVEFGEMMVLDRKPGWLRIEAGSMKGWVQVQEAHADDVPPFSATQKIMYGAALLVFGLGAFIRKDWPV